MSRPRSSSIRRTRPAAVRGARVGGRSARVVSTVLRTTLEVLGRAGLRRACGSKSRRPGRRQQDDHLPPLADARRPRRRRADRAWPRRRSPIQTGRLECDLHATFMTATTLRSTPAGRGVVRALIAERGDPEVDRVVCEHPRAPSRAGTQRARARAPSRRSAEARRHRAPARRAHRDHQRPACANVLGPLDPQWVRRVVRLVLSGATASGRARDVTLHDDELALLSSGGRHLAAASGCRDDNAAAAAPAQAAAAQRVPSVSGSRAGRRDRRVDRHARRHRQRPDPPAGVRLPDAAHVSRRRVRPARATCSSRSIGGRSRQRSTRRRRAWPRARRSSPKPSAISRATSRWPSSGRSPRVSSTTT